jgi:hypothetical protein
LTRITGELISAEDWNDYSQPEYVTALPGSPDDGEEVYFEAAAGVVWHLRYNDGSASTHKWEFVGGPPLTDEILTSETTTSTTFVDLATVGPDITLPLAGDYIIEIGANHRAATSGSGVMTAKLGSAAASDDDSVANSVNNFTSDSRRMRRNGLAASAVIKAMYRSSGGTTGTWQRRYLAIHPVRVS